MTRTPVYDRLIDALNRTGSYISSCGGTRSGKTFANLQLIYKLALADTKPSITSVVSETFPHLKRGAIRDFQEVLGDLWDESCWSKGGSIYTLPNGSIIEFFSADSPGKVHGPARDRLFLNEVQNIPWEIARQLFVRTKGLKILDYNPTHEGWVQQKIEPLPECVTIHSTYKDNPFLTKEQVNVIEANKDDANWWRVYGLGLVGSLDGLIYPNFELIDEMPDPEGLHEVWGLDFGFAADPSAIVRVLADKARKTLYVDEKCYKAGMFNKDIADLLAGEAIPRFVNIWADAAEPKAIAEIGQQTRLKIKPCDKSAPTRSDRLKFQLQWMQGWKIKVTKRSLNWIREARNYTWEKDRDGNILDHPIDGFDHLLDATRYATFSEFAGRNTGEYVVGFAKKTIHYDTLHR